MQHNSPNQLHKLQTRQAAKSSTNFCKSGVELIAISMQAPGQIVLITHVNVLFQQSQSLITWCINYQPIKYPKNVLAHYFHSATSQSCLPVWFALCIFPQLWLTTKSTHATDQTQNMKINDEYIRTHHKFCASPPLLPSATGVPILSSFPMGAMLLPNAPY